ncbi:MAG: hypothetical protein ACKVRP_02685 [Bacteroidota bacterium]
MSLSKRSSFLIPTLIAIPFIARLILVWQDFERLVKSSPLLEDDFFYCLNIARNVVVGNGFSADGETPTTGFQWLHELLCVGITALSGSESDLPFRILLTLQVLISFVGVWLLRRLLLQVSAEMEANVAAIMFAWWLPLLRYGNNGLETVLAIVLLLWFLNEVMAFCNGTSHRGTPFLGFLAGACVLARIDLVAAGVAGFAVMLFHFIKTQERRSAFATAMLWVGAGTAGGLGVVMAANMTINGHPIPDSGVAVQELAKLYAEQFGYSVGIIPALTRASGALLADHPFAQLLGAMGMGGWMGNTVVLVALIAATVWLFRNQIRTQRLTSLFVFALVIGVLLIGLYTLVAPAYWFMGRYLFPISVLLLVLSIFPLTNVLRRILAWNKFVGGIIPAILLLFYGNAFFERWSGFMFDPIEHVSDDMLTSGVIEETPVCHNYDIARWIALNSTPDTRIAMWQGGLVSYMVQPFILHLDGVVNRSGLESWKSGRVHEYLVSQRIESFVDFESVAQLALGRSGAEASGIIKLGTTRCAEGTRVVVYSITEQ